MNTGKLFISFWNIDDLLVPCHTRELDKYKALFRVLSDQFLDPGRDRFGHHMEVPERIAHGR